MRDTVVRKIMAVRSRQNEERILDLLPGLLLAAALAWSSVRLSDYIGVSLMGYEKTPVSAVMVSLILGLVINNAVILPEMLRSGCKFAVKKGAPAGYHSAGHPPECV